MGKRKRLDEMSLAGLEAKLRDLRARRAQAPPSSENGLRRHLWKAEGRVLREMARRRDRPE